MSTSRKRLRTTRAHTERGAALVVGLILLAVLTLLAVAGMTTATSELTMAGNTQYQARAFQSAETGIERMIAAGAFNTATTIDRTEVVYDNPNTTDDDRYAAQTRPRGSTMPPPGYTLDQFSSEHFEIQSTGTSLRNASSTHTQGLFLVAPNSN
jgi:type IV pilus assembly protein PilX